MKRTEDYYSGAIIALVLSMTMTTIGQGQGVQFKKQVVSSVFVSEGVTVGDVNKDGRMDILAGNYWYEAPGWERHLVHTDTLNPVKGYSTTFLNFCLDVNSDGWPDLIRFDQPGGMYVV